MEFKIIDSKCKDLVCIGDVHGEFDMLEKSLSYCFKHLKVRDSAIVVLGDIGFFSDEKDSKINKLWNRLKPIIDSELHKYNCKLYLFRGNHDNPYVFNETDFIQRDAENISVLRDYDILKVGKHNNLIIPGAVSIDKYIRTPGRSYWENETPIELSDEDIDALSEIKIDNVLTHHSPVYPKITKGHPFYAMKLKYDINSLKNGEVDFDCKCDMINDYMFKLIKKITPKNLICGHYHNDTVIRKSGINTSFIHVGILSIYNKNKINKYADYYVYGWSDIIDIARDIIRNS